MNLRFIGVVDVGVLVVGAIALVLPPRELHAEAAYRAAPEAQLALALAEARALENPRSGAASAELARRLRNARLEDWAVEEATDGSERSKGELDRWRALFATALALVDLRDVEPALDYANRALSACDSAGPDGCPEWEKIKLELYQQHLEAGIKSKIDPRTDPIGFRHAGEIGMHAVRISGHEAILQTEPKKAGSANGSAGGATSPTPAPTPGSDSAGSASTP